ncbi:BACON domain-containing protein [Porphyromonas sp.]|uniref:BACON domain-containing protein n=1 Tax=Porphyromonas sp. TaxID=1924944 RepID=UPI0026DC77F6|nr:BACON domain-containing protein [Porphyromonas sp.]MDO4770633.1 BACON domain-containing protein [Porphyromonas sp.]
MKYYIIAILVALSLCITSCRDEQVSPSRQKTELVVSQQETLTLPAEATEHRVSVQTNVQEWTCFSKSSWLQAKASGREIVLSVSANTEAQYRETTVQIVAADQVYNFNVKQHGTAITLALSNQPDIIDQWGAEILVDVNTNVETWTAESSESWVEVTPKHRDDQLLIKVIANDSRYKRNATVTVTETTSGIKKEFQLVQRGMVYFILPFTGYESSKGELINFETNRNSNLVQTPTEYNPVYKFETVSPIFRTILYTVDIDETIMRSQVFFDTKKMTTDQEKAEFYGYLSDEGFNHEGDNIYYSTKHQSEAELKANHMLYTYYPLEKVATQPIDGLPLENTEINSTTPDEIKAYQKNLGREYIDSLSKEDRRLVFRSFDGDKEELHVYYFSSVSGKLIEAIHFYENMPRYMYTADNQKTYFTRELRKAIRKDKFTFNYYSDTKLRYSYLSPDRKTEMLVEQVKHPYPEKGQTPKKMVKIKFQINRNI